MSNIQSYNALIDRFKAFASGHFILKTFSHGQIDTADLEKFTEYPFMHVVPSNVTYSKGTKTFSFQIVLADLPRDKTDKVEFQREVLSDLQRIAEDLVAEITNHRVLFGDLITVQNVSLEPFLEEFHNTLTGWTVSLELLVPYYWDACSIPAEWNDLFESGSGGTGSILTFIDSIVRDNNGNVSLVNDEATPDASYYYGTDDEGVRGWFALPEGGGLTCETIGECQTIIDIEAAIDALEEEILLKADITSISAVGFSNDYNDLDNQPSIPSIAGLVPDTRTISTTAPLSGGGDLTANRTLSIAQATTSVDGYLSATDWTTFNGKQAAITGAATTITTADLTASRVLVSDASGKVAANAVTTTTLGFLDATSSIQTQLNAKGYAMGGILGGSAIAVGTAYLGISASTSNVNETTRRMCVVAGTVSRLFLRTAGVMTGTMAITLMKNGVATAMTFTIATTSAGALYSTTSNTFTVVDGDELSIRIVQSTSTSTGIFSFGFHIK